VTYYHRIGDDGRGLPVDKIRAKLLSKGLRPRPNWLADGHADSNPLFSVRLLHGGLGDSVSGRGVGMDVVKTNIERIGGTIDLNSTPGLGTVFTIKIPLTLAIVSALIVEAGGGAICHSSDQRRRAGAMQRR